MFHQSAVAAHNPHAGKIRLERFFPGKQQRGNETSARRLVSFRRRGMGRGMGKEKERGRQTKTGTVVIVAWYG